MCNNTMSKHAQGWLGGVTTTVCCLSELSQGRKQVGIGLSGIAVSHTREQTGHDTFWRVTKTE